LVSFGDVWLAGGSLVGRLTGIGTSTVLGCINTKLFGSFDAVVEVPDTTRSTC
jgi:hypothetical protein